MKEYLFCDTNTLIRLLEGDTLVGTLLANKRIYISVITEMEMQCKPNIKTDERATIRELLSYCVIVDLTDAIKSRAIKVRLSTRLKLMDAIVGASAIESGLALVTGDEKFSSLRGTDVIILPKR